MERAGLRVDWRMTGPWDETSTRRLDGETRYCIAFGGLSLGLKAY